MSTELICTAEFTAKPNRVEKLIEELSKLIPLTKQESGCLRYEMHRDLEDLNKVLMIERFKDKAAFDVHCSTEYIKKFKEKHAPDLVEDVKFGLYSEVS